MFLHLPFVTSAKPCMPFIVSTRTVTLYAELVSQERDCF